MVKSGYRFPRPSLHKIFLSRRKSRKTPRTPSDPTTREVVQKLLRERVIEPGFVCLLNRFFTVPKPDGSRRPILDLSDLNPQIPTPKFRMEGFREVRQLLRRGYWMIKIDLKSAYHHLLLHRSVRPYLGFLFQGH